MQQHQPPASVPRHIPFSKSFVFLRVGQQVRFRMQKDVAHLDAVDVLPQPFGQEEGSGMSNLDSRVNIGEKGLNVSIPTARTGKSNGDHVIISSISASQSQVRRLERHSLRFNNACQGEQLQLVVEAEMLLGNLLSHSNLDGDAICRLVRKCASWLRPPILQHGASLAKQLLKTARTNCSFNGVCDKF